MARTAGDRAGTARGHDPRADLAVYLPKVTPDDSLIGEDVVISN